MIRTLTLDTPAVSSALVSVGAVKADLGLTDTSEDAWLGIAIAQASAAIASYCRRPEGFGAQEVTETWRRERRGEAFDALVLSRDLSPAITSVVEDGTTLDGTDWLLDGTLLRRLRDDLPRLWCASKIVVAYSAGYVLPGDGVADEDVTAPADLQRCCVDLVVRAYQGRGRDGALRSERVLDVIAQSWDTPGGDGFRDGLPRDVADRLSPYVRWVIA